MEPGGGRDLAMTDERLDSLERRADQMEKQFVEAFPHGDHIGHRAAHDLMIEAARDRKRLITAVKEKTIAGLVWGAMLAVGLACWKYFLSLIGKVA